MQFLFPRPFITNWEKDIFLISFQDNFLGDALQKM